MMKRFYTAIVRRRRLVLAVFALAAVLSVFAVRQVKVDYDINDYLPPESPSTTAIKVMNGAFTGGIPNMRVMCGMSRCRRRWSTRKSLPPSTECPPLHGWTTVWM